MIYCTGIVTADGQRQIVTKYQNPDLFWILRGGGGAYVVALSAILRTFPSPSMLLTYNSLSAVYETQYATYLAFTYTL
ncbi:unnamed protein product [Adineta steineri]|uniref:Uncharacterized protein n=1 Tax=Adineta steineri TaxID=433720 RepID=A0A819FA09_9BILA|nr:unnamed protein product [Adineta steineri]CAF1079958.1 unnamed protein product [Adineta steineri]CAF3861272.1 unnamed protein product [Adineta steineri]CAF3941635.1 unnamed protein product [Adineta steineri]